MKGMLGWLIVTILFLHSGACWAQGEAENSVQAADSGAEKGSTYQFDPTRFGQAMDRATGDPVDSAAENRTLSPKTASLTAVLGRTILSLLVIIGAIYGLSYLLRNMGMKKPFQTGGPLRVMAKQGLSQKSTVYVVSALDRFLIIGESAQGLTCLSELTDIDEVNRAKKEWGWDIQSPEGPVSPFQSTKSLFAPALRSHMEDLERELQEYEEVRR